VVDRSGEGDVGLADAHARPGEREALEKRVGDRRGERLQQVVVNMVANAVKFSAEEGTVQVELRRDDRFVEIVVEDHGVGIKREFLPYVFDRFWQAHTRAGRPGGLGLGLSIVRHIVERHGGSVDVSSEGEGKGATFIVHLPVLRESAS